MGKSDSDLTMNINIMDELGSDDGSHVLFEGYFVDSASISVH